MGRKPKKKSNLAAIFVLLFLTLLIVAFWYFFLDSGKSEEVTKPAEDNSTKVEEIKTETKKTDGKKYEIAALDSDVKTALIDKLLEISPTYQAMAQLKEIPAGANAASERDFARQIVDYYSFAFDYQGKRYIVAADYSGGAHCCFDWYVFTLDSQNQLKRVMPSERIATGGNVPPDSKGASNLIEKNNNLYLTLSDDRFAYYCGSYADLPIVNRYFLVSGDKLILRNEDFKEEFLIAAQENQNKLEKYFSGSGKTDNEGGSSVRCVLLVQRTANYVLAGKNNQAWDDFETLVKKSSPINPNFGDEYATAEQLKKDILERLSENP